MEVDTIHTLHYAAIVALHLLGTTIPIADFSLNYLLVDAKLLDAGRAN